MRELRAAGASLADLREQFGVAIAYASEICTGKWYPNAGGPLTRHHHRSLGTIAEKLRQGAVVPSNDGCWGWRGPLDSQGKPVVRVNGHCLYACKQAAVLKIGRPLSRDERVLWSCPGSPCTNPDHLRVAKRVRKDMSEYHRTYGRAWVARRRVSFFAGKCCEWCGSTRKLELDHIDPKTKIANSIWSWAAPRRLAEIAKCRVLCQKCHSRRHGREREAPLIHGTGNAYRQKRCRCNACRAWNAARNRRNRAAREARPAALSTPTVAAPTKGAA